MRINGCQQHLRQPLRYAENAGGIYGLVCGYIDKAFDRRRFRGLKQAQRPVEICLQRRQGSRLQRRDMLERRSMKDNPRLVSEKNLLQCRLRANISQQEFDSWQGYVALPVTLVESAQMSFTVVEK